LKRLGKHLELLKEEIGDGVGGFEGDLFW